MREIGKYFLIWFMGILMVGCSLFKKPDSKSVASWGDSPSQPVVEVEDVYKEYHVTYSAVSTDSSYWHVQLEFVREGGGTTTIHSAVALPMPYFDFYEVRKKYDRKGECYFKSYQQITKEGFESFYKYAKENE